MRWHAVDLGEVRAGTLGRARVELENAGTAAWRWLGDQGVRLGYHWLDDLGNPIDWDGLRTVFPTAVARGQRIAVDAFVRGPIPPGRYRIGFDVVDETRAWFSEVGNPMLEQEVDVGPRIERRLAVRGGDADALAAQEEPLVAEEEAAALAYLGEGVAPPPEWSRLVLDAHQEGYAFVAGSIAVGGGLLSRRAPELAPYAPGRGRIPGFSHPLVCPSVVVGMAIDWLAPVAGLPALRPPAAEPWVYDGRICVTARRRSGRRRA